MRRGISIGASAALRSASSAMCVQTAACAADQKPSAAGDGKVHPADVKQQPHKLSSNIGDASSIVGEDIPYSTLSNWMFKALHARRWVLPCAVGCASYALVPPLVAAGTLSTMHCVTLACAFAVIQRLNVRGAVSSIQKDLSGKVYVVTGGTSGIGLAVVQQLVAMGATVCVVSKGGKEAFTKRFISEQLRVPSEVVDKQVSFISADFVDQADVASAVQKLKAKYPMGFAGLVNNAGVLAEEPRVTKQNVEEHIAVNFLSPYHLTEGLLPLIRKNSGTRIVYVTCAAHHGVRKPNVVRERFSMLPSQDAMQVTARCYSASKLGNILHVRDLASRRYEGVTFASGGGGGGSKEQSKAKLRPFEVCSVDPGACATQLDRGTEPFLGSSALAKTIRSLWVKDALEGSQSVMNCLLRDEVDNGGHYFECRSMPSGTSRYANSPREMSDACRWAKHKLEKYLNPDQPR